MRRAFARRPIAGDRALRCEAELRGGTPLSGAAANRWRSTPASTRLATERCAAPVAHVAPRDRRDPAPASGGDRGDARRRAPRLLRELSRATTAERLHARRPTRSARCARSATSGGASQSCSTCTRGSSTGTSKARSRCAGRACEVLDAGCGMGRWLHFAREAGGADRRNGRERRDRRGGGTGRATAPTSCRPTCGFRRLRPRASTSSTAWASCTTSRSPLAGSGRSRGWCVRAASCRLYVYRSLEDEPRSRRLLLRGRDGAATHHYASALPGGACRRVAGGSHRHCSLPLAAPPSQAMGVGRSADARPSARPLRGRAVPHGRVGAVRPPRRTDRGAFPQGRGRGLAARCRASRWSRFFPDWDGGRSGGDPARALTRADGATPGCARAPAGPMRLASSTWMPRGAGETPRVPDRHGSPGRAESAQSARADASSRDAGCRSQASASQAVASAGRPAEVKEHVGLQRPRAGGSSRALRAARSRGPGSTRGAAQGVSERHRESHGQERRGEEPRRCRGAVRWHGQDQRHERDARGARSRESAG